MRVFISSTEKDLKPERRAVEWVITRLRQIPIAMEFFPSAHPAPIAVSLRELDSSDIALFIIGFSYGTVDKSGKSMVEQEYARALDKGMEIRVYFKDDQALVSPSLIDLKNATKLNKFKQSLRKHHYRPFREPEELAKLVGIELMECLLNRWRWNDAPLDDIQRYRDFWAPFTQEGGTIVLEVGDRYAHVGEVEYAKNVNGSRGLYELTPSLRELQVAFDIRDDHDPTLQKETNLILDGSHTGNEITRKVIDFASIRNRLHYLNKHTKHQYRRWLENIADPSDKFRTEYHEDKSIPGKPRHAKPLRLDYSYLAKVINPFDTSKICLIASGNHGAGTLACFKVLASPRLMSRIIKKVGDEEFQAIIGISVLEFSFGEPEMPFVERLK